MNFFEKSSPPESKRPLNKMLEEHLGIILDDETSAAMPTAYELLYAFQKAAEELSNRIAFLNGDEGIKNNLTPQWVASIEKAPSSSLEGIIRAHALADSSILLCCTIVHSEGLAGLTRYRKSSKDAKVRLEEDVASFVSATLSYIKNEETGFTSYFGPDGNSENKFGFGAFYAVIAPHLPQRTRDFVTLRRVKEVAPT